MRSAAAARQRSGGWLALAAMLLQLALGFGHGHAEARHGASPSTVQAKSVVPEDGDRGEHDPCAVCAILALVAAGVLPPAPNVSLPAVQRPLWLAEDKSGPLTATRRGAFQARAPPQV